MIINNKVRLLHFYFVAFFILSAWTIYYTLPYRNVFFLITIFILLFNYGNILNEKQLPFILLFGIIIFRAFNPFELPFFSRDFFYAFISLSLLILIFIIPPNERKTIYKGLVTALSIIIALGLFFHVFHILGLPIIRPFKFYSPETGRVWSVYITHSYNITRGFETFRFSSIFDEPGYLGTISAFILTLGKYDLKQKRYLIIFIGGVFTLSSAFYLLSLVYFILVVLFFEKYKKWFGPAIVALTVLFVSTVIFPQSYYYLSERFTYVPGEGLSDNRANITSFIEYFEFLKTIDFQTFLFGEGMKDRNVELAYFVGHASWIFLVNRIGIILFVYMIGLLFFFAIRSKSRYSIIFIIIFILSTNPRPEIFTPIYMFLLSVGIFDYEPDYIAKNKEKKVPSIE